MQNYNVTNTDPLDVKKSRRNHPIAVLTSMPAGKVVPLVALPLFREDSYSGQITVKVEMQETKELLMNGVTLRVTAYVVPWLAFERFQGSRDQFDRSWSGKPKDLDPSAPVVKFIEQQAYGVPGSEAFYKYLGMHAKTGDLTNTMYLESYNIIDNFRAKNRSRHLADRGRLSTSLSSAFWPHTRFQHVVPDFNQAVIDGQVALNVINAKMPVSGIGFSGSITSLPSNVAVKETGKSATVTYPSSGKAKDDLNLTVRASTGAAATAYPEIYAELQQDGLTISLANFDMARQTATFARLRQQYEGFDDDWIIDMLMDGVSIPEQYLKQPILIGDQTTLFTQAKRYATDSGNLAESATSGAAQISMNLRVPTMGTGGVIMVLAEAVPVQLFERQQDPFFHLADVAGLPSYLRDTLDPEKVDVVFKREIDTDHDQGNEHFGYAPMGWKWTSPGPKIGGDFFRPEVDAAVDDLRMRIWAVETANPTLAEDFYRVGSGIHIKPFLDDSKDPFQVSVAGQSVIIGNTVFGPVLPEAKDENYEKVAAKAPTQLIQKA